MRAGESPLFHFNPQVVLVRRLTLGALILGGGTLLSLPFRRPALPDPTPANGRLDRNQSVLLDDQSIEMLVREVTQDVEVPTVYHPHTDFAPATNPSGERVLPLSYEDLAIPVDRDPFYESRFNATSAVASRGAEADSSQRIAELERKFDSTRFADQTIAELRSQSVAAKVIPTEGKRWQYRDPVADASGARPQENRPSMGAQFASSDASILSGNSTDGKGPGETSVLSPLPPPDDRGDADHQERTKQWIRQPD